MPVRIHYRLWLNEIKKTNSIYRPLFKGKTYPPIFFFGDPEGAIAATVGVNPSAGEFLPHRGWGHDYITLNPLLDRCRKYFNKPIGVQAHPWFQVWEEFLREIGISYRASPRAVHLDFSPRATRSISSLQKESGELMDLFLKLVEMDLKYFLDQLRSYPLIKYLYMAGSVTKRYYAIKFLSKKLKTHGYWLKPIMPFKQGGIGQVGLYKLDLRDSITRHLFFCSTSPSSRVSPHPLPQRAQWLKKHYPLFIPDEK